MVNCANESRVIKLHSKVTYCFILIIYISSGILFLQVSKGQEEGAAIPSGGTWSGNLANSVSIGGGSREMVTINVGDVYIDKFTDKVEYNKSEPITVTIRIHSPKKSGRMRYSDDEIYIYEELFSKNVDNFQSKTYEFINSTPDYDDFKCGELIWHFNNLEDLLKTKYIEYTINTGVSGLHVLGNTRIETDDEIKFSLSRPEIKVINHLPIIENVAFPDTPIWCGDINYVKATVRDPDNDQFTCNLYYNGLKVSPVIDPTFSDMYNYTWDLSGCSPGNHIFKIKADDGVGTNETDGTEIELREKMFGVLPCSNEHKLSVITCVVAGLMLSGILEVIKRSTRVYNRDNIKRKRDSDETSEENIDQ